MKAHARYIRTSPRKIRLVADMIRGMGVIPAETQLMLIRKGATAPLLKLLHSAVANAMDQFDVAKDQLVIARITVDGAPMLKRWRPRAFGRATPIKKRGSHITLILESTTAVKRKEEAHAGEPVAATLVKGDERGHATHDDTQHHPETTSHAAEASDPRKVGTRHEPSHGRPTQKKSKGFLKKIFSRKTA